GGVVPILVAPPVALAQSAAVSIQPPEQTFNQGQDFSVDVVVDIVDATSRGWQFALQFDPNVVRVTGITPGALFQDFVDQSPETDDFIFNQPFNGANINNVTGVVGPGGQAIIGGDPTSGVSGQGVLATVNLRAFGGGTSSLTLQNVVFSGLDAVTL